MKLLFLTETMLPGPGGSATEVIRLTEEMTRQPGVQITIACLTPGYGGLPFPSGVQLLQFDSPVFLRSSWRRAVGDLRALINEHDLVFTYGIWDVTNGLALRLSWQSHKPIYVRISGSLAAQHLPRRALSKRLAWLFYLQQQLRQATGVIVANATEADRARKAGVPPEKILIIPNAVEPLAGAISQYEAKSSLGINPHRPVLLYVDELHPDRGLHTLLQAMALLPTHKRNFTLLVGGEYSTEKYRAQIEELICNGGLQPMVHFSDSLKTDRALHFRAADGFISPSRQESSSGLILEALSFGLPVIVSSACNLPQIADYQAGIVMELSVANLTRAIGWFQLGGIPLTAASINALRLFREQFSPEQSMKKYRQLFAAHTIRMSDVVS